VCWLHVFILKSAVCHNTVAHNRYSGKLHQYCTLLSFESDNSFDTAPPPMLQFASGTSSRTSDIFQEGSYYLIYIFQHRIEIFNNLLRRKSSIPHRNRTRINSTPC
jgi:hypothetical protein